MAIDPGGGGGNLGIIDRCLYQMNAVGKDPITAVIDGLRWWWADWRAAHPYDYWQG